MDRTVDEGPQSDPPERPDPFVPPERAGPADPADGEAIMEEILRAQLEVRELGRRPADGDGRVDTDRLGAVVRHGPALEALLDSPMDRREMEDGLGVSRATSHRLTRWLDEQGYVEKRDGRFHLTGTGQAVAEEVLRFERNVGAAEDLGPLLDCICEDHQEFVVEPFADATVTTASPEDPYAPVRRFTTLVDGTDTFRGFNTTHMVPVDAGGFDHVFDGVETEIIYLPNVVERLFEASPDRATAVVEAGHLTLRTREALPYGLAIFDDRVGIGGYDEDTGSMRVFVDTEAAIAREWAERVYAAYRERSTPIEHESGDGD